jgi:hypothetical protein
VIAPPEGHGAAHRLDVVAAAAAGAGVDEHVGVPPPQFVPVRKVAGDVLILGDALAVGRVVGAPVAQGVRVEVLAIEVDALLGDQAVDVLDEPLPCLRVAEVQDAALLAAQDPFGVLLGQPRAFGHALGLEPDENLDALRVRVIADRLEALGEPLRVQLPRADLRPSLLLDVPAGVHPPVIEFYTLFEVPVDVHDLVGLVGADHLAVGARAGCQEHRGRQLAVRPGHAVGHHPAAPDVLRVDPVFAFPELEHDERRADFFARQKLEACEFLPGPQSHARGAVAGELGGPLAGPPDGHDHPLAAPLQVEVREVGVGRPAAGGADALDRPGR